MRRSFSRPPAIMPGRRKSRRRCGTRRLRRVSRSLCRGCTRVESLERYPGVAEVADTIAPEDGRNVLVGRVYLGGIAALARERKPLITESRTRVVDNLPSVSGKPDFAHQSSHVAKEVAVTANGVRAIAAVLEANPCGSASQFTCAILFNDRSGHAYRIWMLPLKSPATPAKYTVDSKTLHVEQEH